MQHAPATKADIIKRALTYALMTIVVILAVALLVLFAQGYRFDRKSGEIEQIGLVQLGTKPSGAAVRINGDSLAWKTTTSTKLVEGTYSIEMEREGYRTWQKSVFVRAGSVVWLNYARLIPTTVTTEPVASLEKLASSMASPNKKYIATTSSDAPRVVTVYDLASSSYAATPIALPAASITVPIKASSESLRISAWDSSSRYILVEHRFDNKKEWLVVDRDEKTAMNLNALFDVSPADIQFHPDNSRYLYVLANGDVRRVDIISETMSRVYVGDVERFTLLEDSTVLYVTNPAVKTKQRVYGAYLDGSDLPTILGTAAAGKTVHIAGGEYYGETYIARTEGEILTLSKGILRNVNEANDFTAVFTPVYSAVLDDKPLNLQIHTDGRFVVAGTKDGFITYDVEMQQSHTTSFDTTSTQQASINWFDNFMLWDDRDGTLTLREFDGANAQQLALATPGQAVTLSENGQYMYWFGPAAKDGSTPLLRFKLVN